MNAAHSRTARTPANATTIDNLKAAWAPADADAINIPKLPAPGPHVPPSTPILVTASSPPTPGPC